MVEQQQEDSRFIVNDYKDYNKNEVDFDQMRQEVFQILIDDIKCFNQCVKPQEPISIHSLPQKNQPSYAIFDGAGGNFQTYLRLYQFFQNKEIQFEDNSQNNKNYLNEAEICFNSLEKLILAEKNQKQQQLPMITFFFSSVGIYTLGCELFFYLNKKEKFYECVNEILEYKRLIVKNQNHPEMVYEILYGMSGYLYCLLKLQKQFQFNDNLSEEFKINFSSEVQEISQIILEVGIQGYSTQKNIGKERLYYHFYKTEYIGAAHGVFGILYLLLTAYKLNQIHFEKYHKKFTDSLWQKTKQTFDVLLEYQFKSGNFPTSYKNKEDKLVQFCHGSPGSIAALLKAFEVFQDKKYFDSAVLAADNIWNYGILKKGFNLCHGITGNAFGFFTLYNETKDDKYLYRAMKFICIKNDKEKREIISKYKHFDRVKTGVSDNPLSLMMGLTGDIIMETYCFENEKAKFPGYEI